MRKGIELLAKQYHDVFEGSPWYGDSAKTKLAPLDPALATAVVPELHRSISQVVAHMTAYHRFAIARLRGDAQFDVPYNSEIDWPPLETVMDWDTVYQAFKNTQHTLRTLISEHSDEVLDRGVAGKEYGFQFLLDGIIQHTAYHLGQIGILHRLVVRQQTGDL